MKNFFKIILLLILSLPFSSFADQSDIGKGGNSAIKIDLGTTKISDQKYSIQQDDSGLCKYVDVTNNGVTEKALQINSGMFNTDNILMGLSDPAKCPLPGTDFLPAGYPDALSGEFILSGVICVVQSIILDSMFRVYCTILLWFYQILYAMMVIYVMFYGLAIIFGLTDNPVSEAPKRIFFIIFIFFMAVNAEVTFKWIFQTFNTFLDTFSNIITRIQPLYDEDGRRVYDEEGHLLAENGEIWQPLAANVEYVFANPFTESDGTVDPGETTNNVGNSPTGVPVSMQIKNGTYTFVPITNPLLYSPYRVPAQQWQSKIEGTGANKQFKVYPVFRQFNSDTNGNVYFVDNMIFCTVDFIYSHQKQRVELYPRCHQKNWTTIPEFAPYGAVVSKNLAPQGQEGVYGGFGTYNNKILKPKKLLDEPANLSTPCDEASAPKTCRMPFQGILGKVDALFDSVLGDDNAKSLASLAIALALWGVGGGAVLSLFLMTGVLTMFTAFVQIIWVYVTALMGFVFLMMLAPIFISFKLFKITEPMFKAWVSMIVSFMWQPIIILGFVYVLSNATTLDRLSMLAKNELGEKRYETTGEGGVKGEFTGPGFLEPAYQMPPDYSNARNVGADELAMVNNKETTLLSRTQREKYRAEKSKFLLTQHLLDLGAVNIEDASDPNEVASVNGSQKAKDFLTIYNAETTFTFPPVAPATVATTVIMKGADTINEYARSNTLPPDTQLTSDDMEDFVTLYNSQLGVDDRDAFRGEPPLPLAIDDPNWPRPVGEYPRCVKNCPSFDPPYDINDQGKVNPTKEQCVGFCLYIHDNDRDMFAYMAGAMIIWVVLNAMTGAFMAKVPQLAEALSRLYDLKSGVALFGASQSNSKPLLWASGAQSDFYHPGGLFDTGLTTGRPGVIMRAVDRVQQIAGKHKVADAQGGFTDVDKESLYNWGGVFGMKSAEQKRNEEIANKTRDVYFAILKSSNAAEFNDLKINNINGYNPAGKNQQVIEKDINEFIKSKPGVNDIDILKRQYMQLLRDRETERLKKQPGHSSILTGDDVSNLTFAGDRARNQITGGGESARGAISSINTEQQAEKYNYLSPDQIDPSLSASLYDDRPPNLMNQRPMNEPVLDAGGVEYQRGGSVSAEQRAGAATATVLSAAGITATGKNILAMAKMIGPDGKINEKYREQFVNTLKKISPEAAKEADKLMNEIEGLSSRIIITNDNDTRVVASPDQKLEDVSALEVMSVVQPIPVTLIPTAPVAPVKPLAALTSSTGILSKFSSNNADGNTTTATTVPDRNNEVPDVANRTTVATDYKAPEEAFSLSRNQEIDYDKIRKVRGLLKPGIIAPPDSEIQRMLETLSENQIADILNGLESDSDSSPNKPAEVASDMGGKSSGFKDVDEMVSVSSIMSSSENSPEREVVIAQPVQVSNVKSSIYASSNDQAEEIITDNSQRISEYAMKKQEEVPEAGISRTDVVPERIYSEVPVADSRSEVSFAGTEQSQAFTIDKQVNEQPQNFAGEAASDNQPSVSTPVVQNAQNSVQPIEYNSPFADLLKKEEESTPYQFSGKNDVGDNSSGSGISGMARETPSILPTSEGIAAVNDMEGLSLTPETPKAETAAYTVELPKDPSEEMKSIFENMNSNVGKDATEFDSNNIVIGNERSIMDFEPGVIQIKEEENNNQNELISASFEREETRKIEEVAYEAAMLVDVPQGVSNSEVGALAKFYAQMNLNEDATVIAGMVEKDLERVASGKDIEEIINDKKEFFASFKSSDTGANAQAGNEEKLVYGREDHLTEETIVDFAKRNKKDKKGSDPVAAIAKKVIDKLRKGEKDTDINEGDA